MLDAVCPINIYTAVRIFVVARGPPRLCVSTLNIATVLPGSAGEVGCEIHRGSADGIESCTAWFTLLHEPPYNFTPLLGNALGSFLQQVTRFCNERGRLDGGEILSLTFVSAVVQFAD